MTIAVIKIIFDTKILVSRHFWKGPAYRCLAGCGGGYRRAGSLGAGSGPGVREEAFRVNATGT